MGIYSMNNGVYSSEPMTDVWSPCEQEIRCEGVDINFHEAALMAVAESERVYNNAMKEIGIAELHYFEENGQEMIYEAVDVHGALEKIKKFFVKLIDKIKAIFHAFVAKMGSFFSDNKDFATKYKKEFFRKWNDVKSDFEFKGYNFTINGSGLSSSSQEFGSSGSGDNLNALEKVSPKLGNIVSSATDKTGFTLTSWTWKDKGSNSNNRFNTTDEYGSDKTIKKNSSGTSYGTNAADFDTDEKKAKGTSEQAKSINEMIDKIKDDQDTIVDEIRANTAKAFVKATGGKEITSNSMDASEFSKELFEAYRNNESAKENIEKKEMSSASIISNIENADKVSRDAKKATDKVIKSIEDAIKELEKQEKELGKTDKNRAAHETDLRSAKLNLVVTLNGFLRNQKEFLVSAEGIYLQALKDECAQSKAIVAKVIAGGKKMQRESYDYYEDNNYTGSYLDTVVIR